VRRPSGPQSDRSSGRTPGRATKRPRLTGRAAILVLVLAVLTVSYASSLRAYLQQRQHIDDLNAQIDETGQDIQRLEREKRRWDDDAYVATQARQRLNYVFPGEESYIVLDDNGEPLDSTEKLSDPGSTGKSDPTAWWTTAWGSVEAAGNPPSEVKDQGPAGTIKAPAE
jgi:cell division protein FtsB